jgi:hypothetical protein
MATTITFTARSRPRSGRQWHYEQINPEIADQRPIEVKEAAQRWRRVAIDLNPVAAHVAGQVGQRRDVRPQQRDRGGQDEQRQHPGP